MRLVSKGTSARGPYQVFTGGCSSCSAKFEAIRRELDVVEDDIHFANETCTECGGCVTLHEN